MKKTRKLLSICGFLAVANLYGCSFGNKQIMNENEMEITLSLDHSEENEMTENAKFSRGDLLTMFEEINNESVVDFLYDDYNKDGVYEAFVLTKADTYNLWYMSPGGCEIVQEGLKEIANPVSEILAFRTKDYLLLQQMTEGNKNTLVYSIDNNNKVITTCISGKGYIYQNEDGELLIEVPVRENSSFKEQTDSVCTYYLYYVLDEGFKEYGAIPISEEQFLEFEGAQEILDKIYEQYQDEQVECSFLYRSNHYININITIWKDGETENKNIIVKYDEYEVKDISGKLADGKVETAYKLDIATFPTAFKHPDKKVTE